MEVGVNTSHELDIRYPLLIFLSAVFSTELVRMDEQINMRLRWQPDNSCPKRDSPHHLTIPLSVP